MAPHERIVRFRAVVTGRVQGVGFRLTAARVAQRLDLTGWVANAPDGSVIVEAQGRAAPVDQFMRWLQEGPGGSQVTGVDLRWTPPQREAASFDIRTLPDR